MDNKTEKLNRENNKMDERLEKHNQEVYTDMICYIRGADISEYDIEVVRRDLLEMLLSAQERGEDIENVIGGDYKGFCDDVIASLTPKTVKQKVLDFIDVLCWSLSILGFINIMVSRDMLKLIENAVIRKPVDFNISISVGAVISTVIIIVAAVIIVRLITKNSFKETEKRGMLGKSILGGVLVVTLFLVIAWIGKATLFKVNIFIAGAAVIILYIVHKLLEHYSK